jgi:hypothetical protein
MFINMQTFAIKYALMKVNISCPLADDKSVYRGLVWLNINRVHPGANQKSGAGSQPPSGEVFLHLQYPREYKIKQRE